MAGTVVLLSGGLDSTVCLAIAAQDGQPPIALSFDYGQRHRLELDRAAAIAAHYGAEHLVVHLATDQWGGAALTDSSIPIPAAGSGDAIPVTYVPARNIIFLSVALGVAEARNADAVMIGVNALDYSGYPDCRPEFIDAFARIAELGQKRGVEGNPVRVQAPLVALGKAEIVTLGQRLGAPLDLSWSCYAGGVHPCGECDACVLRARGFAQAGAADPALSGDSPNPHR